MTNDQTKRPRAPRANAWDEIRLSQEHIQGALREAAMAAAAVARLLASLRPHPGDGTPPALQDRALGALIAWLEGVSGGEGKAIDEAVLRKAKDEALDAILSVLVDEVERIDDADEPERHKDRREALTSIIGILVRQKSDAPPEAPGERIRRVPVE